jgi:chorismate mutase
MTTAPSAAPISTAPTAPVRSTTAPADSAGRATLPVHKRTRATLTEQAIDATDPSQAAAPELIPVPQDQEGIDVLRKEIDAIDAELVKLILHRTAISHAIGTARKTLGGPKIVYSREMAILERFRALGPAGTDLGMLLLAMGRGRLGRK